MTKLGLEVTKRLLHLLHRTTSIEIATKLPKITKFLKNHNSSDLNKSLLDDLTENQWKQLPILDVLQENDLSLLKKSNILKFQCVNSYINDSDFKSLFPINRERKYHLQGQIRKNGFDFMAVKARHPINLIFNGFYYLIFKNYIEAAVYYIETKNKSINGMNYNLQFTDIDNSQVKSLVSPYFDYSNFNEISSSGDSPIGTLDHNSYLAKSPRFLSLTDEFLNLLQPKISTLEPFKNYDILEKLLNINLRKRSVLVRNLPYNLKNSDLTKFFAQYQLADENPICPLLLDPKKSISLYLIRFADVNSATSFVRNNHGKRWQRIHQETMLYDPVLCEAIA